MMRDPAGVPMWLQIVTLAVWMFGLGVWVERNRFGGTRDLHDRVDDLKVGEADLLAAIDELTATHAQSRLEVVTRRAAAMHAPPSAACGDQRDLHLIRGGQA